jgi:hypothetical protein
MRSATSRLALIVVTLVVVGAQVDADTASVRLQNRAAGEIAGCLAEVMARVAPQLGLGPEDLRGLSGLPVPERNEVTLSGPKAALALAEEVIRALDIPVKQVWLRAVVVGTEEPGDVLRLPDTTTAVEIQGRRISIPHEALGMQRPLPRELPTLVCVPNPDLTRLRENPAGQRVLNRLRVVTLSGREGLISALGEDGRGDEVAFLPSVLPDGSISVVLTLYHKGLNREPDKIELAYVGRDGEPWAFAMLRPEHEQGPTTVFVVTVSAAELE